MMVCDKKRKRVKDLSVFSCTLMTLMFNMALVIIAIVCRVLLLHWSGHSNEIECVSDSVWLHKQIFWSTFYAHKE